MQLYGRYFSIFICDVVLEDSLLLSANLLNFPVLVHKSLIQSIVGASVSVTLNLLQLDNACNNLFCAGTGEMPTCYSHQTER
jgi:hypothetical protein